MSPPPTRMAIRRMSAKAPSAAARMNSSSGRRGFRPAGPFPPEGTRGSAIGAHPAEIFREAGHPRRVGGVAAVPDLLERLHVLGEGRLQRVLRAGAAPQLALVLAVRLGAGDGEVAALCELRE